jgi:AcrR family transcriptional regulator
MKNISTKKKDILAAAAKIFGEKGLDNSSLDEVAAEAGVAKGTIFYYFSGKEELFSSLIEEGIDILSGQIKEIIQKKISTKEKLDKIINSHFLFFKQNRNICLMILG